MFAQQFFFLKPQFFFCHRFVSSLTLAFFGVGLWLSSLRRCWLSLTDGCRCRSLCRWFGLSCSRWGVAFGARRLLCGRGWWCDGCRRNDGWRDGFWLSCTLWWRCGRYGLLALFRVAALFRSAALFGWLHSGCCGWGWRHNGFWLSCTLWWRCRRYGRYGLLALFRVAALFRSAALLGWLRSGCRWLGCTLWRYCGRCSGLFTLLIVATLLGFAACISRTGFGGCRRWLLGWWCDGLRRSYHFDFRRWCSRSGFQFFASGFLQRFAGLCCQLWLLCRETGVRRRRCRPGDDGPLEHLDGWLVA